MTPAVRAWLVADYVDALDEVAATRAALLAAGDAYCVIDPRAGALLLRVTLQQHDITSALTRLCVRTTTPPAC